MDRFAHIFRKDRSKLSDWDKPIAENEYFAAIFSIGALVPGWVLIVPRRPVLNLSQLENDEKASLIDFCEHVVSLLRVFETSNIYAFEHGATVSGSLTGCSTDHGHLHLVPLDFNLIKAATTTYMTKPMWQHFGSDCALTEMLNAKNEYILIYDWFKKSGIRGHVDIPVSQWVRRVIASKIGKEASWDYRKHPQTEMIELAANKLKMAC